MRGNRDARKNGSEESKRTRSKIERAVKERSEEKERGERDGTGWLVGSLASTLFPEGTEPGVRSRAEGTDIRPNDCHVITG